jgi:hypothetical protein
MLIMQIIYDALKYFCGVEVLPPFKILLIWETITFNTTIFPNGDYFKPMTLKLWK